MIAKCFGANNQVICLPTRILLSSGERCEAQWLSSAANGDTRGALDTLKTAVRLELENRARLQEQAEAATETASRNEAPSREWITGVVTRVRSAYDAAIQRGAVWCPICERLPVDPKSISQKIKSYQESHGNGSVN